MKAQIAAVRRPRAGGDAEEGWAACGRCGEALDWAEP